MLPFGVTIPATVPQGSEIPEGLMNNPVYSQEFLKPCVTSTAGIWDNSAWILQNRNAKIK
jgi:hypothetical protein